MQECQCLTTRRIGRGYAKSRKVVPSQHEEDQTVYLPFPFVRHPSQPDSLEPTRRNWTLLAKPPGVSEKELDSHRFHRLEGTFLARTRFGLGEPRRSGFERDRAGGWTVRLR